MSEVAPLYGIGAEERAIEQLEKTGNYRVLRRFDPQRIMQFHDLSSVPADVRLYRGLFLDAETTGLDIATAKIIELGAVSFPYDRDGVIYGLERAYSSFEDPGIPIPAEITELTGITDEDVAGQKIDDETVGALIADASLVIAYNAGYDRPICERRFPALADKPWACAMREVPWTKFGARGQKHDYLLTEVLGLYFDAHRALDDCYAGVQLLAAATTEIMYPAGEGSQHSAPGLPRTAFQLLLDSARTPKMRVHAIGSPFEKKDLLKSRKYKWCGGEDGRRKSWWIDVPVEKVEAEKLFLTNEVYQTPSANVFVAKVTSRERYSSRV